MKNTKKVLFSAALASLLITSLQAADLTITDGKLLFNQNWTSSSPILIGTGAGGATYTGSGVAPYGAVGIGENVSVNRQSTIIGGNSSGVQLTTGVGTDVSLSGEKSSAVGQFINLSGDNSIAMGSIITSNASGTMSFGSNINNIVAGSVIFSSYAVDANSKFDFGGRTLTNYIVSTPVNSTDAANKGYVDTVYNNAITYTNNLFSSFGGGGGGGSMDYGYVDAASSTTLAQAQSYADQGDANTLQQATTYAKSYTDAKIDEVKQELRGEIHRGTALAIALSTPVVIENGKKQAVNIGVGQYKSASAIGITYARRVSKDTFVNFGASFVEQDVATRAGVNYSF